MGADHGTVWALVKKSLTYEGGLLTKEQQLVFDAEKEEDGGRQKQAGQPEGKGTMR